MGTQIIWLKYFYLTGKVFFYVDTCDSAVDLRSISSPFSGTTTNAGNNYQTICGGKGPESIFYVDLQPGESLAIGQTTNDFDSRHHLATGGHCPGYTNLGCHDDPDEKLVSWTNELSYVMDDK